MKKTLEVKTGTDEYKILIGDNILLSSGSLIKKKLINPRVFIITNKLIYKLYGKKLENSLKKNKISFNKIIINDGEKYKNIKTINLITSKLLKYKVDRNDTLIAFGGGVIGDIVGFTASITLRGINFIQIPTTLLSQVDSAVGGKTGVNTKEGKNLIGTFYQPKLVISDVSLLKSLPKREILSGYDEIIKYGQVSRAWIGEFRFRRGFYTEPETNKRIPALYTVALNYNSSFETGLNDGEPNRPSSLRFHASLFKQISL